MKLKGLNYMPLYKIYKKTVKEISNQSKRNNHKAFSDSMLQEQLEKYRKLRGLTEDYTQNIDSKDKVENKKLDDKIQQEMFTTASIPYTPNVSYKDAIDGVVYPNRVYTSYINLSEVLNPLFNEYDDNDYASGLDVRIRDYIFNEEKNIEDIFEEIYDFIITDEDLDINDVRELCILAVMSYLNRLGINIPYNLPEKAIAYFFTIYNHIIKNKDFIVMVLVNIFLLISSDNELTDKMIALAPVTIRFDSSVEEEFANVQYVMRALVSLPNNVLIDYINTHADKLLSFIKSVIDKIEDNNMYFNMYGDEIKLLAKLFLSDENAFTIFTKNIINHKLDILDRYEIVGVFESICAEYTEYIRSQN